MCILCLLIIILLFILELIFGRDYWDIDMTYGCVGIYGRERNRKIDLCVKPRIVYD